MPLTDEEVGQLTHDVVQGHSASAAIPFIRRLAREGRVEDIPLAVQHASGSMEINRGLGTSFLAHRVPAFVINHYWPERLPHLYHQIIRETIADPDWSSRVVDAVENGDGERLRTIVDELQGRAEEHAR
jgi:hypothetical protein